MDLFKNPGRLVAMPLRDAFVETPIGTLAYCALGGSERLSLRETFAGRGGLEVRRYSSVEVDADLVLFLFEPKIPEHMRVDGCFAAVWRVRANSDSPRLALRAMWGSGSDNGDGGYASGEHLTALTWDSPKGQVSVGTSDEEMLEYAAEDGFLPRRLATVFRKEESFWPKAIGERDGLEVFIPPLLEGETAQVHLVVAWVGGEVDLQDISTWFAVDVNPKEISRLVDEGLR